MMSELVSSQFNTTQLTLTFTDSLIPQITALFLALSSAMDVKCPVIMGVICNVYCLYLGNRCKGNVRDWRVLVSCLMGILKNFVMVFNHILNISESQD